MKIDLDNLSIEELAALRDSIIEKLVDKVAARQRELEDEIAHINALTSTTALKKPVAKYRHPDDHSKVWSGRGARPRWIEDEIAGGKTLEQLAA